LSAYSDLLIATVNAAYWADRPQLNWGVRRTIRSGAGQSLQF